MSEQMPSARVPVTPSRRLLRSLAVASALACSALVSSVLPGDVAAAAEADTVVGELVQAWPDDEHAGTHGDHEDSGPLAWVETAGGDAVRVPAEDVAGIAAGSTVEVTVGEQMDDEASTEDGFEPARTVLATDVLEAPETAPARTDPAGLTNQVTVVLVTPGGAARDGVTEQQIVAAVNGPVAEFWAEQTGGAVRLGVTASRNWTSTTAGCSDPAALWNEVAGIAGFTAGPGRHLMLYVSDAAKDCSYALAEVGASTSTGGRMYVRDDLPSVIAHEFGHNFGLGHSSAVQCEGTVEDGACRTTGYRDFYDVMGVSWSQLGALNAPQAEALGVLPADAQQTVSVGESATTVSLAPLAGGRGIRGLRLVDAEGVAYWLELRSATGRDGWLSTRNNVYRLDVGVLLHRAGTFPDTSLLLDGTPGAAKGWDADLQSALPAGVPIRLSGGDFTVTVRSVDGVGAVVNVVPSTLIGGMAAPAPQSVPRPGTLAAAPAAPAAPAEASDDAVAATPAKGVATAAEDVAMPRTLESGLAQQPVSLEPAAHSAVEATGDGPLIALAGGALAAAFLLLLAAVRRGAARAH